MKIETQTAQFESHPSRQMNETGPAVEAEECPACDDEGLSKRMRCDGRNCGREAEVVRDGRRFCSWHWAEFQFDLSGVWVNPALGRNRGRRRQGTDRAA